LLASKNVTLEKHAVKFGFVVRKITEGGDIFTRGAVSILPCFRLGIHGVAKIRS
tara:strand:+ start:664 stop:825 length:162 start_codon:yes stop_codon:yes gene_type:complete